MKPKPHGRGRATARARSRAGRTAFAHLSATDGMTSAKSRRRLFSRAGTSSAALSVGLASLSVFAMGGLPYGISALYRYCTPRMCLQASAAMRRQCIVHQLDRRTNVATSR